MATANELREMKPEEMKRMLGEQSEGLFNLKLKLRTGHLENTASLPAAKKDIARLATVLRENELGLARHAKGVQSAEKKAEKKGEKPAKSKKATKAKAAKGES